MTDLCERLLDNLGTIAQHLIVDVAENQKFRKNPDSPSEHEPTWHQFGIMTHTRKFAEFYDTEKIEYLKRWELSARVEWQLKVTIDGKSRAELLPICIPLHDIGKFSRGFKTKNGILKPDYDGHEKKSEYAILQKGHIRNLLRDYALTGNQIEYIARCAGLHYELGKLRNRAKESDLEYTMEFVKSDLCLRSCSAIASDFPEFKTEIGILFLCDSLAKTDIRINAETDSDIENQTQNVDQIILRRFLNPALIAAVKQNPVNIAVAKRYLESVLADSQTTIISQNN